MIPSHKVFEYSKKLRDLHRKMINQADLSVFIDEITKLKQQLDAEIENLKKTDKSDTAFYVSAKIWSATLALEQALRYFKEYNRDSMFEYIVLAINQLNSTAYWLLQHGF